jgi:predicted alpha/beta-fold hydrolase
MAALKHEDFAPRAWLRSAHLQTLGASLALWSPPRAFGEIASRVERLRFALGTKPEDGALHAEAWWQPKDAGPSSTAILVHGVGGSIESQYVLRAGVSLYRAGFHVVRLNLRGAGSSIADAPALYHAGLTEDFRVAIDALLADARVKDVSVLGFSLGGNAALKLAGEWGASRPARVRAVAAVSPPLDLAATSAMLHRLRSYPYKAYVLKGLVAQGTEFARLHPGRAPYDVKRLAKLSSIKDYDDTVIAPMHGFDSADTYYREMSSGLFLPSIGAPTLLVHAADDPMIPSVTMQPWLKKASPSLEVAWSDRGGHVGFFGSLGEDAFIDTWAMKKVVAFFKTNEVRTM